MSENVKSGLDLAVIGNCVLGGLVDRAARLVWCCFPDFESDPWFNALLGGEDPDQGVFAIDLDGFERSEQFYQRNSAVLTTRLYSDDGSAIEVTDCAPRYKQFDRTFRPTMVVRRVRPLAGTPRVRVRLRPTHDYGAAVPERTRGSNHARFIAPDLTLRLYTTIPLSYVLSERWFLLEQDEYLILGPDESLTESIEATAVRMIEQTDAYWRGWTRSLSIPFEWQEAVIRAAITLKLSNFEETGAIIAALTTSVPEAPDSGRNWDYRFCWLRDSYFVVNALNRLGATKTMEGFLRYILNIVSSAPDGYLQPVFGIGLDEHLYERKVTSLPGYRSMGPVRVGNQAYTQIQNDGYGSVVLAATQCFFDCRLISPGGVELFRRLEALGEQARLRFDQPDAGPWELRGQQKVHTYSSLMCWAACDRLARIARHLGLEDRHGFWRSEAERLRSVILERSWNERVSSFVESFEGEDIDASLLLMHELGFIDAQDPRYLGTLAAVERELKKGNYLYRYHAPDDFGVPETAFTICTFWYIDALAAVGRREEARELFEHMLSCRNHVGLLSEDLHPETGELWGNFPQTYSLVGVVHSATRLSKSWEALE
ncbi:glycoside hydrolase family 15 protein [Fodinicurvata fenggangensis]|uniref:glycoside hydrolase family 15 protein n=1 Tax=Fodinicurvata fenggangensis TaxID=1121830 RepID=UPI00047B05E1|nr:glycoside hydrolase family 15 protein [Fodinicurvata fenggangensis]